MDNLLVIIGALFRHGQQILQIILKDGKAVVGIYTDERREGLAAYTNGCAFEPLYNSGIQYGVSYYAVPENYIVRANQDVFFDSEYKDAKLRIYMRMLKIQT